MSQMTSYGRVQFDKPEAQQIANRIQEQIDKVLQIPEFAVLKNAYQDASDLIHGTSADLLEIKSIVSANNQQYQDLSTVIVLVSIPLLKHQAIHARVLSYVKSTKPDSIKEKSLVNLNCFNALELIELIDENFYMPDDVRQVLDETREVLKKVIQDVNAALG